MAHQHVRISRKNPLVPLKLEKNIKLEKSKKIVNRAKVMW